jgi:hypothetical protein
MVWTSHRRCWPPSNSFGEGAPKDAATQRGLGEEIHRMLSLVAKEKMVIPRPDDDAMQSNGTTSNVDENDATSGNNDSETTANSGCPPSSSRGNLAGTAATMKERHNGKPDS